MKTNRPHIALLLLALLSLVSARPLQAIEVTLPNVTKVEQVPVPDETLPTVQTDPADTDSVLTAAGMPTVIDQADLFSAEEEEDLGRMASSIGRRYTMDLVIVTTEDAEDKSSQAYADDYFDYNGYGADAANSGVLFLIDMDNREFYISTTGEAIRFYTDVRVESSLDEIEPYMLDGEYAGAAGAFLETTEQWLIAGIPSNQYTEMVTPRVFRLGPVEIALSILAAVVAASIFIFTRRRAYRARPVKPFFDARLGVIPEYDEFRDTVVNRYVTQRYIPPANTGSGFGGSGGSSGRSSTHMGSSGTSHGGGGRGF